MHVRMLLLQMVGWGLGPCLSRVPWLLSFTLFSCKMISSCSVIYGWNFPRIHIAHAWLSLILITECLEGKGSEHKGSSFYVNVSQKKTAWEAKANFLPPVTCNVISHPHSCSLCDVLLYITTYIISTLILAAIEYLLHADACEMFSTMSILLNPLTPSARRPCNCLHFVSEGTG